MPVFHLYIVFANNRNKLLKFCKEKGIEAKVHYPKPMYLQDSVKNLKHKRGDFPITDKHTKTIITFPCDQHLKRKQLDSQPSSPPLPAPSPASCIDRPSSSLIDCPMQNCAGFLNRETITASLSLSSVNSAYDLK